MGRVRLTAVATRDLRQIRTIGIRDHGATASAAHVSGFERLVRLLRDNPRARQERPEFHQDDIRSLSHHPHRIFYRIDDEENVLIVRIIHHARDVVRAFRDKP